MQEYFLLAIGLIILLLGGKFLVDGASSFAIKLGMSPGLIGLTIVAFGTSAPEMLVSVNAALKGNSDISIGNVLGSNIANLGMVLGLSSLLYPIFIQKSILRFEYFLTLLATGLFYFTSWDGAVSRWEGGLLFGLFILFNVYLFRTGKVEDELIIEGDVDLNVVKKFPLWKGIGLFLLGVVGLYFGSELMVDNAVKISRTYGISERIIGVTIIAIGTSLPELITSVIAAFEKKTEMALGNILGSNIMNILSIIGLTALIKPIQVNEAFLQTDYWWMIGITVLLFPLMRTRMKVSKLEGSILVGVYVTYLYFLL